MTKEQLQQANELYGRIDQTSAQLNQVAMLLDEAKDDKIKTRIRGMDFELPKAAFRSEVNKRKAELETQLGTLQAEFDAL